MDFQADKPIYLQIADGICERILSGELASADGNTGRNWVSTPTP